MVGDLLPSMEIVFKNEEGEEIALDDAIVMQNGRELKVWQTVAEYAMSFEEKGEGVSQIPETYRETGSRLVQVEGRSLWFWPKVGLILLIGGLMALLFRKRRLRK